MLKLQTPTKENWDSLIFDKVNWDLEVKSHQRDEDGKWIWLPYQIVTVKNDKDEEMCHCEGGRYGRNNWYCYPLFRYEYNKKTGNDIYYLEWDKEPNLDELTEFSGHAPVY